MRKISSKIILAVASAVLLVSFVVGATSLYNMVKISNEGIEQLESKMYEAYDQLIQSEVNAMTVQLNGVVKSIQEGIITEKEGKLIAANMIRLAGYGESGYFWVDDFDGNNVVLLGNEKVEGKNRIDLQDKRNQYIVKDMIAIARAGGGYYDYYFPKPNETEALPKRAYVMMFEEFNWVIGTGNYTDDIVAFVNNERAVARKKLAVVTIWLLSIGVAAIGFGSLMGMLVSKKISKPIVAVTELINYTADLDLTYNASYEFILDYKDETGVMANAITKLRVKLREVLQTLQEDSHRLSDSSNALNDIATLGKDGIDAVNETAIEFAKGATDQAIDAQEASESMVMLSSEIDESVHSAIKLKEATQNVEDNGKRGGELVQNLSDKFQQTVDTIRDLDNNVQTLSIKSSSISDITTTIQAIAEQTNLLALNAAIEAARAGDAGKGFAVVAEEIRKLAEQTSKSTTQINTIISEILAEINLTQANMNQSNEVIQVSGGVMVKAKKAFEAIDSSMIVTMEQLTQISESIDEVSRSKDSVTHSIQGISAITEENAAASEEISATMDTQVDLMSNILERVEDVNDITKRLNDIINQFSL